MLNTLYTRFLSSGTHYMQPLTGSKVLLIIGAITFLSVLSTAITEPIRPLFITGVGSTTLELGLIMALQSIVSVIARLLASAYSETVGKWRLILASLLLSVGSTALFAFVYEPLWFFPAVALSALSWAIFSPISLVMVLEMSAATSRGAVMGLYFTAIGAALFVGPLVCSFLTLYIGFRELYLASTAFPLLALLLFIFRMSRAEVEGGRVPVDKPVDVKSSTWSSVKRIFRVKNVTAMFYAQVVFAISYGVYSTLFSIHAEGTLLMAPSVIALLFSLRAFTNLLIRFPGGRISDRIGRKKPVLVAHSIIVVVFTLLPFTRDLTLLVALVALYGVGWGLRVAPDSALVSESVNSVDRSIALAILMTMFDIGVALGSLMVGVLSSYLSISNLFLLCAPILLSGLVIQVYFIRETLN